MQSGGFPATLGEKDDAMPPAPDRSPQERRRRWILIGVGALLLLFGVRLVLDFFKSDEERIVEVLEALAAAVEDKHPRHFMENISEDYSDPAGLGAVELRRVISGYLMNPQRKGFTCLVVPDGVEVDEDGLHATVELRAAVYEGLSLDPSAPPAGGQAFLMEVRMRKEEGDWRVLSHTRRRFPADDLWKLYFGE